MARPWRILLLCAVLLAGTGSPVHAQEKLLSWDAAAIARSGAASARLRDGSTGTIVATVNTQSIRQLVEITTRITHAAGQKAQLYIVTGTQPNAFASKAGGSPKVAINLAMLELHGDDVDAYASVIGHEIAHLAREHGAHRQSREATRSVITNVLGAVLGLAGVPLGGTIANLGTAAVASTFSRDEEREADVLGIGYMKQAGYDPMGGVRAWERMSTAARTAGLPFLSTHPAPDERLATMRELAAGSREATTASNAQRNPPAVPPEPSGAAPQGAPETEPAP